MNKIVIITNIPSPYRVDFFHYLQANCQQYQIYIIYSQKTEGNRCWEIETEKMHNSYFLNSFSICIKGKYDNRYIHIPKGICKLLGSIKPDIVVGMEYNPTILQAVGWCRKNSVPLVNWTDGTLYSERNISTVQRWSRKYIMKYASSFIASSSKAKEKFEHYGISNNLISISLLTVDIDKYKYKKENYEARNLLYVGSLIGRKGLELLFKALAQVRKEYHLVIIGNGDQKENLQALAEKLGITANISFKGFLEGKELEAEYRLTDIFVLPTKEDCYGLVLLEAMCNSLPVLCSKYADGAYDLIDDTNGLIVDPYNSEEFVYSLDQMLGEREKLAEMGQNSYNKVDEFTFEKVAVGFCEAVDRVIS